MQTNQVQQKLMSLLLLIATGVVFFETQFAFAEKTLGSMPADQKPKALAGVGIYEKLGQQLNLDIKLKDESGTIVSLRDYYDGKHPVIISPVYFNCPGLCNFHLNGFTEGLKGLEWNAGEKFTVLAVSFDTKEDSVTAAGKKASYLKVYDRPGTENGWHFLTGDPASITELMEAVGFRYKWNEEANEWAHASAAIVTSPSGVISRYLPGITFEAKDIKFALNEASQGKIGTFIDNLVLYCFKYDPVKSKYTFYAYNAMKMGGGLMVAFLALWLLPIWFKKNKEGNETTRS